MGFIDAVLRKIIWRCGLMTDFKCFFLFYYSRFKKARQQLATSEAATGAAESPTELNPKGRNRSASATEPSKTTSKKYNPIFSSKYAASQSK